MSERFADWMHAQHERNGQAGTAGHSWTATPLGGDVLDEDRPDLILGLFYCDKRHLVYGETECQKTWLTLCAAAEVVRDGRTVLWIDHEMSSREIRRRLDALGCSAAERDQVHYIHPAEALGEASRGYLAALLDDVNPALVVVDAFSGALGCAMLDDNSNVQVEQWWQTVGQLLWGPERRSLVILDHVNKNEDNRGKYPSGSKRKLEGADVGLMVEAVKRLGRDPPSPGLVKIATAKDRPGWLGRRPGDLELDIYDDGRISWRLVPVLTDGETFAPTALMEKVSRHVEANPGLTQTQIVQAVGGKAQYVRQAIQCLVSQGYLRVTPEGKQAHRHASVMPYRQGPTVSLGGPKKRRDREEECF